MLALSSDMALSFGGRWNRGLIRGAPSFAVDERGLVLPNTLTPGVNHWSVERPRLPLFSEATQSGLCRRRDGTAAFM